MGSIKDISGSSKPGKMEADFILLTCHPGCDRFNSEEIVRTNAEGCAERLSVEFDERGSPLNQRVARHPAGIEELLKAYSDANPSSPIVADKIPPAEEVMAVGIGPSLN